MKKLIGLFVIVAFAASLASVAFGRTLEEEKTAVRSYLKVVDAKIVKARNLKQTAKMKKLQAEKAGTLRRWAKLQAEMTAAPIAPPMAPMAPIVAPRPVAKAAGAGLFGWGINADIAGIYLNTGNGSISGTGVVRGDWILDDFVGLGPMIGLSAKAINYKVGLGVAYGGGQAMKAIPLFVDGVINLPADMMGGLETYLAGGLNYTLYGNGSTTGKYGAEISVGMNADLGLGLGKTGFELGWGAVRSNTASSKGITFGVCQPIVL